MPFWAKELASWLLPKMKNFSIYKIDPLSFKITFLYSFCDTESEKECFKTLKWNRRILVIFLRKRLFFSFRVPLSYFAIRIGKERS